MSFLSSTGRIVLIKEPISGRFGMPRLLAKLTSNSLKVNWDGEEEITIITFNKRRSIAKILHLDHVGSDLTTRVLDHGLFKVVLDEEGQHLPQRITREQLERLFVDGTLEGDFQNPLSAHLLKQTHNFKLKNEEFKAA